MEWITIYCYLFVCLLITLVAGNNVILPSFSWDPRNECFNKSIGIEKYMDSRGYYAHLEVDQDSQIYFICPSAVITYNVLHNYVSKSNMFENMHMCTKEEFEDCKLGNRTDHTRRVMNCDKPLDTRQLKYMYFSFGLFKKSVNGFAFHPNKTYYFIATSDGTKESLPNRKEGRCRTHNMRLAITICDYGKNCHEQNKKCDGAVMEQPANNIPLSRKSPKVEKPQKNSPKQAERSDSEINPKNPDIQPQKSPEKQDNIWKNKTFMLCIAAIGGFFIGLVFTSCTCMLLRKRQGSDTGTIEENHTFDNGDSAPVKEEMNQKYFSSIEYRNSNEFKRLLSTTSTLQTNRYSDSDRHSATPLGYYQ